MTDNRMVSPARWPAGVAIETTLARIRKHDSCLNAFTTVLPERAAATAAALDRQREIGSPAGPLTGVPFAVKNLIDIAGVQTLAGSKINRDTAPARRDATLVRRLEAAGAVLVGGLNMGEYAYDFTGENPHYGPSRNPHDPEHMSGGSSGGCGTAVAAGLVPVALGSDTNGSIRVPSSFCGVFGLKPTFGRLPRSGSFPFAASLDHLGPIAESVSLLAATYDVMQGADDEDPVCVDRAREPSVPTLDAGLRGIRIARAGGYFASNATPEALQAVADIAEALGATRSVEIPDAEVARCAAQIITAAEAGALHLDRLRTRASDFDPIIRDRLFAATTIPAAWVDRAQRFRRWYRRRVSELFRDVDIILAPTTPFRAPKIGATETVLGGKAVAVRPAIGLFTQPLSFIGLPVVSVPRWVDGGLPLGVQIIAAPWREELALRVAFHLEKNGLVHIRRPLLDGKLP
jgi:aspartyl-tRNA(Asn)/glutamyl-tRNA(Gln) amidotransferase subunit A